MTGPSGGIPSTPNHHWDGSAVTVKTANVFGNAYLTISGTSTIGPAGFDSAARFAVGNARVNVIGEKDSGYGEIANGGSMYASGGAAFIHSGDGSDATFKFDNGGLLDVASEDSLALEGGYFVQGTNSTLNLNYSADFWVADNTGFTDGALTYGRQISVTGGTVIMYSFADFGAAGDIRFNSGGLTVKSPGQYEYDNMGMPAFVMCGVFIQARELRLIDSPITFLDWTPAWSTSTLQGSVPIELTGDLYLDGTTKLWVRTGDRFSLGFGYDCTLNGSGLDLHIWVEDWTPDPCGWSIIDLNAGTMTAPNPPMSSPSVDTGWSFQSGPSIVNGDLACVIED
jgi:hypothetical protein